MGPFPKLRLGRTKVYRAQLELMEDGRIWCVACCNLSPAPDTDDHEGWRCAAGHPYWYHDEMSSAETIRRRRSGA